jgi:murein DD-endopeptidase MepM/ murein hydrolase activator NlpD
VPPKQRQPENYRGRRRLPKLPSRRYAAVVATAFFGALLVALAAGAVMPASGEPGNPYENPNVLAMSAQDRLNAMDQASRSDDRGPALSNSQAAPIVWVLPVECSYEITTLYEMRWGVFHWGVDLACPYGTPIHAAADGIVIRSGFDTGGYGNVIMIDHGGGIETIYGHASSLKAKEGQHVKAGDVVSYIGSTGYSTGNHCHYEIHINGKPTDPIPFMMARGVDIKKHLEAVNGATIVGS